MQPDDLEAVVNASAANYRDCYRSPYWIGVTKPPYDMVPMNISGKWVVFTDDLGDWRNIVNAVADGSLTVEAKISTDIRHEGKHAICVYSPEPHAQQTLRELRRIGISCAALWKADADTMARHHGPAAYRYISPKGLEFIKNALYTG